MLTIYVITQPIITCYDDSIVLRMSPFTTLIYVHINAATIQDVQKCCYQKVLERPKLVTLGTYQTPPTND